MMFCYYCRRLWSGSLRQTKGAFAGSNFLECPWCNHYVSVDARPEHGAKAMNRSWLEEFENRKQGLLTDSYRLKAEQRASGRAAVERDIIYSYAYRR
jgi:hypothetical protein